jgi:uncharacterized protein (TIGR02058 family)
MGMGVDVHGQDYTKAARRAVSDAIRHSSIGFFRALDVSVDDMHVDVTVAVARPDAVDIAAVAAELPHGKVSVTAVQGGLDVAGDAHTDTLVIANAAVVISIDGDG